MPDHPEVGEEAFVVERDAAGAVWLAVTAFSRLRMAGPPRSCIHPPAIVPSPPGTSDPCLPA
ncbi:DUF1990 domain-containing protein [Frankia sp. Cpl3]|nr:DUF1990 domain-containing protein [Frankia sp. Cpl3]